jgi:hypothetical protein
MKGLILSFVLSAALCSPGLAGQGENGNGPRSERNGQGCHGVLGSDHGRGNRISVGGLVGYVFGLMVAAAFERAETG